MSSIECNWDQCPASDAKKFIPNRIYFQSPLKTVKCYCEKIIISGYHAIKNLCQQKCVRKLQWLTTCFMSSTASKNLHKYMSVGILQIKQGNRRLPFAHAVHSRRPLPDWSHFQRMQQRWNDPLCCVTLLAIQCSLLEQVRYSALSMGKQKL